MNLYTYQTAVYWLGMPYLAIMALWTLWGLYRSHSGVTRDEGKDYDSIGGKDGVAKYSPFSRVYGMGILSGVFLLYGLVLCAWGNGVSFDVVNVNGVTEPVIPIFYVTVALSAPLLVYSVMSSIVKDHKYAVKKNANGNTVAFNPHRVYNGNSMAIVVASSLFAEYLALAAGEFYLVDTYQKWWMWSMALMMMVMASFGMMYFHNVFYSVRPEVEKGVFYALGWSMYCVVQFGAAVCFAAVCICGPAGQANVAYDSYRLAQVIILGVSMYVALIAAVMMEVARHWGNPVEGDASVLSTGLDVPAGRAHARSSRAAAVGMDY